MSIDIDTFNLCNFIFSVSTLVSCMVHGERTQCDSLGLHDTDKEEQLHAIMQAWASEASDGLVTARTKREDQDYLQ